MKRWGTLLLLTAFLLTGCGAPEDQETAGLEGEELHQEEVQPPMEPITATLAFCGDVMSHMPVTRDAWDTGTGQYDYLPILGGAVPYVQAADYAVANLETTLSEGEYSGFPRFRSPDGLAASLKNAGFDLLLTANNHCCDAGFSGLCRTLDVLDQVGLAHVGTSRTAEEAENGVLLADVGGISVAFLGYTYGTNGIPLSQDAPYSVNLFHTDYLTTVNTVDTERLTRDLERAKAMEPDLIAVLVHWGTEYRRTATKGQEELADFLIAQGADLVLGGHSHVPEPMEVRQVKGEDGADREGFVCYSLGNLISSQRDPYTDVTAVLQLELTKTEEGSRVTDWSYIPLWMQRKSQGERRFTLMDVHKALREGTAPADKLQYALDACRETFGAEHDVEPPEAS